jgi:hypothetical protein
MRKLHSSPLSTFAHKAKADKKKSVYMTAMQEAKNEQLKMIEEGKAILAQKASA